MAFRFTETQYAGPKPLEHTDGGRFEFGQGGIPGVHYSDESKRESEYYSPTAFRLNQLGPSPLSGCGPNLLQALIVH